MVYDPSFYSGDCASGTFSAIPAPVVIAPLVVAPVLVAPFKVGFLFSVSDYLITEIFLLQSSNYPICYCGLRLHPPCLDHHKRFKSLGLDPIPPHPTPIHYPQFHCDFYLGCLNHRHHRDFHPTSGHSDLCSLRSLCVFSFLILRWTWALG